MAFWVWRVWFSRQWAATRHIQECSRGLSGAVAKGCDTPHATLRSAVLESVMPGATTRHIEQCSIGQCDRVAPGLWLPHATLSVRPEARVRPVTPVIPSSWPRSPQCTDKWCQNSLVMTVDYHVACGAVQIIDISSRLQSKEYCVFDKIGHKNSQICFE